MALLMEPKEEDFVVFRVPPLSLFGINPYVFFTPQPWFLSAHSNWSTHNWSTHRGRPPHLLDEHGVPLLVVVEAEAVAGAERHQLQLGVQRERGDHGGRLALHQGEGLEAGREQHRVLPHVQSRVALHQPAGR